MIELSPQLPQTSLAVSVPAAPGGAAGGFVQVLAAFLDSMAGAAPEPASMPTLPADRQSLADDGNALPATIAGDEGDTKDPVLIWLPAGFAPPLPPSSPIQLPGSLGLRGAQSPPIPGEAGGQAADPRDVNRLVPVEQPGMTIAAGEGAPSDGATTTTDPVKAAFAASPADASPAPAREARVTVPLPGAAPQPPATGGQTAIQPAGQAFAAAMAAATAHRERSTREDQEHAPQSPSGPVATAQVETASRPVVQAVPEAKHTPLDLRNDRGLQGMIDRIETLRDDVNARDTRIRLVPDALGGVDVAVRKEGDAVHVHFTADTQATRALLVDAQPRLAELAEARGVKLGQTSVDAGAGGGANAQAQPRAPQPRAPVSAVAATEIDSTDQRLA